MMLTKELAIYIKVACLLICVNSTASAAEFVVNPLSQAERCRFVTGLVDSFQQPLDERLEPITLNAPWSKDLAEEIENIEDLMAYLADSRVDVYSEEQLLELDLRPDRIAVFVLENGRIQSSCG